MTSEDDSGGSTSKRAEQDDQLVELLAHGFSYAESGAFVGLVARSVGRRMSDPRFRRRVSIRRGEVVAEVTAALVSASQEAVTVLQREMRAGDRAGDRIRAAALLLTTSLRFRHGVELEARLEDLEVQLGVATRAGDVANGDPDADEEITS